MITRYEVHLDGTTDAASPAERRDSPELYWVDTENCRSWHGSPLTAAKPSSNDGSGAQKKWELRGSCSIKELVIEVAKSIV
jgi:hypothetical protein